MINKTRKRKGGFFLVEVVIALSVIVLVTISALTICISSISAKIKTVNQSRAISFSDNVWECFKAADDEDDFISYVQFAEGITLKDAQQDGGYNIYTYFSEENNFTATIAVKFASAERPELKVDVTDKSEELFISFSYTKGGGA